jgi:hypothetical protein
MQWENMEANFRLEPKNPVVAAWSARANAKALGLDPDIAAGLAMAQKPARPAKPKPGKGKKGC